MTFLLALLRRANVRAVRALQYFRCSIHAFSPKAAPHRATACTVQKRRKPRPKRSFFSPRRRRARFQANKIKYRLNSKANVAVGGSACERWRAFKINTPSATKPLTWVSLNGLNDCGEENGVCVGGKKKEEKKIQNYIFLRAFCVPPTHTR